MFTLKIQSYATNGNADPIISVWLPGVKTISRIGSAKFSEVCAPRMSDGVFASYREAGLSDYTRQTGPTTPDSQDPVVALLWVEFHGEQHGTYVLVERAWLLSPTGATVDRLT